MLFTKTVVRNHTVYSQKYEDENFPFWSPNLGSFTYLAELVLLLYISHNRSAEGQKCLIVEPLNLLVEDKA